MSATLTPSPASKMSERSGEPGNGQQQEVTPEQHSLARSIVHIAVNCIFLLFVIAAISSS